MQVTPVWMSEWPLSSGSRTVEWPTRTPPTSVIAFAGPGPKKPRGMFKSRGRVIGRSGWDDERQLQGGAVYCISVHESLSDELSDRLATPRGGDGSSVVTADAKRVHALGMAVLHSSGAP